MERLNKAVIPDYFGQVNPKSTDQPPRFDINDYINRELNDELLKEIRYKFDNVIIYYNAKIAGYDVPIYVISDLFSCKNKKIKYSIKNRCNGNLFIVGHNKYTKELFNYIIYDSLNTNTINLKINR
jgi:uncharacterized protein YpmS